MKMLKGTCGVSGVGCGKVVRIMNIQKSIERNVIKPEEINSEINRFHDAMSKTSHELKHIEDDLSVAAGKDKAAIITAQYLIASDPEIIQEVEKTIERKLINAEAAVAEVFEKQASLVGSFPDEYLAARSIDFRDVADRLLHSFSRSNEYNVLIDSPSIILAHDLSPSQTAGFNPECVKGIVLSGGGLTSHTVILARSLGIPVVLAVGEELDTFINGQRICLDAEKGMVYVDPDREVIADLEQKRITIEKEKDEDSKLSCEPTKTLDGEQVEVYANIGSVNDAEDAINAGADGIGLFRTENLFYNSSEPPTEEEQFEVYKKILKMFVGKDVLIRTLDIGGDKQLSYLEMKNEQNPFLGVRGIRFSLKYPQLLKTQIRALYRASVHGKLGVIFPMISVLEEFKKVQILASEVQAELHSDGIAYDPDMALGVMIETPSAAITADRMAQVCSFFSLGTNDLLQYTLAVDRLNDEVSNLYQPECTALARLIAITVDAAKSAGISVGVCGEIAGDPRMVPLLLGLGLRKLSVAAPQVSLIKKTIRGIILDEALSIAEALLLSQKDK